MPTPDHGLFLAIDGDSTGPHALDDLVRLRAEGRLKADALLWYEGQGDWLPLGDTDLWPRTELQAPAVPTRPKTDDEHDAIFSALIKDSWRYFHLHERTNMVDDVLVGAIIASTVENGWALIDLTSDGSNHYLRFEDFKDQSRVYFRLAHLTTSLASAKAAGNMVSVLVGYGERTNDFGRVWQTIKQEYRSGLLQSAEPGTITFDADINSGYIHVQIDMYWTLENYVAETLVVNHTRLSRDIDACLHSLRRYLRGRTGRS